jgi:hypothetical protein
MPLSMLQLFVFMVVIAGIVVIDSVLVIVVNGVMPVVVVILV